MNDLLKNKKIIFVCILIIVLVVGGYYLVNLYKINTMDIVWTQIIIIIIHRKWKLSTPTLLYAR